MVLSFSNIVQYLINQLSWISEDNPRGQNSIDDFFIRNDYSIQELKSVQGRNRCFAIVNLSDNRNYFLKQPKSFLTESIKSVVKESIVYDIIWKENNDLRSSLGECLPRMYDYNSDDIIIITSFLKDSDDFTDTILQANGIDGLIPFAKEVGTMLNLFHKNLGDKKKLKLFNKHYPFFKDSPPMALLGIDFSILEHQRRFRGDLSLYIEVIQQDSLWSKLVKTAINNWKKKSHETFVHGDFSTSNILISSGYQQREIPIYFIDWELSSVGNYLYDLATLKYSLLCLADTDKNKKLDTPAYIQLYEAFIEGYRIPLTNDDKKSINTFIALHYLNYFITKKLYKKDLVDPTESVKIQNLIIQYFPQKQDDTLSLPPKNPEIDSKIEQIDS